MGLLRRRWLWITVLVLVLAVAVTLAALPEIVRRVAVKQIAALTGRAVVIEDVDLNVFTGRTAITGFRLAQRGSNEPALEIRQIAGRVAILPLLRSHARVVDLAVLAPRIHVTRTGPTTFDFSDLLELIPPADPNKPPSKRVVTVDRLTVRDGALIARDQAVSPTGEWRLEGLSVDGAGLTTAAGARPGRLAVKATLNGAALALDAGAVALSPLAIEATARVDGLRLRPLAPYVPAGIRVLPRAGTADTALTIAASRAAGGALRGSVGGDVRIESLELIERERPDPFTTIKRVSVAITTADLATRAVTVKAVEVDGLLLNGRRGPDGVIDLLSLIPGRGAGTPTAAAPAVSLLLERVVLTNGSFRFRDERVAPVTTLVVSDLTATLRDVTWPSTKRAALEVAMTLPEKGRLTVTGTAVPQPLDADLTMSMRGASIAPYAAYFPFKARLRGIFNGDSRSRVKVLPDGSITAVSKGQSVIESLTVIDPSRPPGTPPAVRIPRVSISGLDFVWPKYAKVARVVVSRPDVRLEREADGSIPLRTLFLPARSEPAKPPPGPKASSASARAAASSAGVGDTGGLGLPIAVEVGSFVIEEGLVRFADRTTTPPFTESISRLAVNVDGISTTPGQRAKVRVQAIVGGNSALDLSGEVSPLGTRYADLAGELRDFTLPAVNPYADHAISWIIQRGRLAAKVAIKLEGDQLTARNEMVVADLTVAPSQQSDEVRKRLGLPLGLIVALIKDGQGLIKINVPIAGNLSDPTFDLGETIWTAIKNVLVNVLAAPFRAIGRLFTGSDNKIESLSVEPVIFPPGTADVPPPMEQHLVRVAGFLRGAPGVSLALSPVVAAKDVETLRGQELTARLQKLQRERGLPSYPAAVAAEFRAKFPGVTPPESAEQQLARLLAAEPVPAAKVKELQSRRIETVREALVKNEGIPEARLRVGEAKAGLDTSGEGRVEFAIQ